MTAVLCRFSGTFLAHLLATGALEAVQEAQEWDVPPDLMATGVSSWCPEPGLSQQRGDHSPPVSRCVTFPTQHLQLGLPYPKLLAPGSQIYFCSQGLW